MAGTTDETFEVLWPQGRLTQSRLTREERLPEPRGKTIAFIWDYVFRGDEMLDIIREEFQERGLETTFVGYSEFGDVHGAEERALVAKIPDRLLQHRVDAAIVGVGA